MSEELKEEKRFRVFENSPDRQTPEATYSCIVACLADSCEMDPSSINRIIIFIHYRRMDQAGQMSERVTIARKTADDADKSLITEVTAVAKLIL